MSCKLDRARRATIRTGGGFTLVEILIVVMILAIIAAVTVPGFSNASAMARASMIADNLRLMRMQISVFKNQHLGVPPGYPGGDPGATPTYEAFVDHMTGGTNADCEIGDHSQDAYPFGPYFREIAANPMNDKATVQIIPDGGAFPSEGDNSHGYIYKPQTCEFRADSSGSDENGKLFFEY